MAQSVPVSDVFAKYGTEIREEEYELLRKVTHWKPQKVEQEKKIEINPSFVLIESFSEILNLFEFTQFVDTENKKKLKEIKEIETTAIRESKEKEIEQSIEIWKKTIDVQQHFNDLELRIRNFALTVLGVILSASALAFREDSTAYISPLLLFIGFTLWMSFYGMDRLWYHRLLAGAVKHGIEIENKLKYKLPVIGLTDSIGKESPFEIRGREIHSKTKMDFFYSLIGIILLLSSIGLLIYLPFRKSSKNDNKPLNVNVSFSNANNVVIPNSNTSETNLPTVANETPTQTVANTQNNNFNVNSVNTNRR
jgi:hypothetical protein